MSIPEATIREIRSRVDLVEFIGRTVALQKRGASFQGCCPFHDEKTPSFDVNAERGTYHCFGCQEQGDVFRFVMKTQSLRFPEAVRHVAAEVGVEVAQASAGRPGGRASQRGAPALATGRRGPAPEPPGGEVREIGEAKRAKVVEIYDYTTRRGHLLYQVCRMEPKTFRQRRPHPSGAKDRWVWGMKAKVVDGYELEEQPTVLYRIPELAAAIAAEDPIWIVEGEKDVEAMRAAGEVATTNSGGAGKWRDELATPFRGYRGTVRIVQDRDSEGQGERHARAVFDSLTSVLDGDATLQIFEAAVGKDPADHLGAGKTVQQLVQVWPLPENLVEVDPKRFKQLMLRRALEHPTTVLEHVANDEREIEQPLFQVGLENLNRPIHWQGCVVVSGAPSAGKSWLAIATAIDNAIAGWDVWYLSCEMSKRLVKNRAAKATASAGIDVNAFRVGQTGNQLRAESKARAKGIALPDRFHRVHIGIGVTIEELIEFLAQKVTERPTLVVLDSISSFVDNMANDAPGDSFGMGSLREVTRWVTGVSAMTHGMIAFLLLSELNKEGRAKGRSLDHRCDFAIAMTTAEEESQDQVKQIRTTKSWWGPVGKIGDFVLWGEELGRLSRIEEHY